jgi:hypothetical protein
MDPCGLHLRQLSALRRPGRAVAFCEGDAAQELGREPPDIRRKVIVDGLLLGRFRGRALEL